jgi:hypothetical protein
VQGGPLKNLQIGALQAENAEICTLVAEQQLTLELLMTRYREAMCDALRRSRFDLTQLLAYQTDQAYVSCNDALRWRISYCYCR